MSNEDKVEVITEGGVSTVFTGSANLPVKKMTEAFNANAAQGWDIHFVVIEERRFLLFWKREGAVVIYSRERA